MAKKPASSKTVATLQHEEAKRKNIPTAEYQSILQKAQENPIRVAHERRNRDLDPQLVWRGKVQCIYFDPPDGIRFNPSFKWSTTSRDVKDGNAGYITRERVLSIFLVRTYFKSPCDSGLA